MMVANLLEEDPLVEPEMRFSCVPPVPTPPSSTYTDLSPEAVDELLFWVNLKISSKMADSQFPAALLRVRGTFVPLCTISL